MVDQQATTSTEHNRIAQVFASNNSLLVLIVTGNVVQARPAVLTVTMIVTLTDA